MLTLEKMNLHHNYILKWVCVDTLKIISESVNEHYLVFQEVEQGTKVWSQESVAGWDQCLIQIFCPFSQPPCPVLPLGAHQAANQTVCVSVSMPSVWKPSELPCCLLPCARSGHYTIMNMTTGIMLCHNMDFAIPWIPLHINGLHWMDRERVVFPHGSYCFIRERERERERDVLLDRT